MSFSTWSNDSTWNPTIFIGTHKVCVNITPRFLGVILDRSLTFNAHLKKLNASLTSSIHIIRATVHTSCGWHSSTLKMAFHALVRSKLDYAAPAWQPWLSNTNLSCLDCLQNCSLRLITGQLVSTPVEALRLEAHVQSYPTCSNCLILKAKEKALRSTDNNPKRIALDVNIPQCLQNRSSFHGKAEELSTLLPYDQHRQKIIPFPSPPWQQCSSHKGRIATTVPGITGQVDDTNLRRQYSLTTITSYQADYVICTDGSASRGTRNRGTAAVVTRGPHFTLKWSPPSEQKEEHSPALMRRKQLPWNQHYPGYPPTPTILQSPYSFPQTVSPCVKLSSHPILEHSQSTIPSTPYRLPSSFNGSLAVLPFEVTI